MMTVEIGGLNILHLLKMLLLKFVINNLYLNQLPFDDLNTSLKLSQENRKTAYGDTNGLLPIQIEPTKNDIRPPKKSTKASRFVAKLSPKKFQRKREITKIATMKVTYIMFAFIYFKSGNFFGRLDKFTLKYI